MNTEIKNTAKVNDFKNDLNLLKHKTEEIYIIAYTVKFRRYITDEDRTITMIKGLCIADNTDRNRKGFLLEVDVNNYELFEGEITIKN